jgi:membrane fusion protein, adhesin transport system
MFARLFNTRRTGANGTRREPTLSAEDIAYLDPVRAAHVSEVSASARWALYLMLAVVATAVAWAHWAQVDIVAKADSRVVPDGKEQVIASLEGGILRELLVREGQAVQAGDRLALLDPTRFEAQQAESQTKRLALLATIARLVAESQGRALVFPPEVMAARGLVEGETENHRARQTSLQEAVALNQRSIELLKRELAVAEGMSTKGLMSEVEVMRVRRQINDLSLQMQERGNRFRQDASSELVRVRTELRVLEEQLVVRDDQLARTVLTSPVKGIVKNIRQNTLGGVVGAGASILEIVPVGSRVRVEARIKPADIGFVKVGHPVTVKLSAYEYTLYGGLAGTVESLSPDALVDPERNAEGSYYRALISADATALQNASGRLQVLPGMLGVAEVRTGQRSVLEFLLRPLLKSQEAFRER